MPYSSWFRPTARLFMVRIEDLGGDRGRSEVISVMSRSNRYHGTSQALASRFPGVRARQAIPHSSLMVKRSATLVQNSRIDMGEVLSSRLGLLRTYLVLGRQKVGSVA